MEPNKEQPVAINQPPPMDYVVDMSSLAKEDTTVLAVLEIPCEKTEEVMDFDVKQVCQKMTGSIPKFNGFDFTPVSKY